MKTIMKTRFFFPLCLVAIYSFAPRAYAPPTSFTNPTGLTLYGIDQSSVVYLPGSDSQLADATSGAFLGSAKIFEVDPLTGVVTNMQTVSPTSELFSIATQPGTDVVYCVYTDHSSHDMVLEDKGDAAALNGLLKVSLGKINPSTGVITKVADFSYESSSVYGGIPGITFDCEGILYAVSGGKFPGTNGLGSGGLTGSEVATDTRGGGGLIFSVNLTTGELTLIVAGGTGRAHSIESNPQDGLLYHFYSLPPALTSGDSAATTSGAHMETVDPTSAARVDVPLTGSVYEGIQGVVYAGAGTFLGHQSGETSFYAITSAGVVEFVGSSPDGYEGIRGLAYNKAIGCQPYQPDLLIGKRASNLRKDNFYTETGRQQTVRGIRMNGRIGSTVAVPLELQNDGSLPDRIRLRWSFKNLNQLGQQIGNGPRFRNQVFVVKGGKRTNVTNAIQKGGLAFNPGEKKRFVFRLKVRREPRRNVSNRNGVFRAVSRSDGSKKDVGKAFFIIRK